MPSTRHARHDRRALAALVAVFALMVQVLIPAAAMADAPDGGGATVICTAAGTQTIAADGAAKAPKPGDPQHGFGGMPCQDCLAAAMAAVTPPPCVAMQPVVYTIARVEHAPVVRLLAPRARAPPRPPGQGPPTA